MIGLKRKIGDLVEVVDKMPKENHWKRDVGVQFHGRTEVPPARDAMEKA